MRAEEFWAHVYIGEHWLWTGRLGKDGYARVTIGSTATYAHKYAWEEEFGPVPEGMELGHTCEFRHCVLHVRPVTHQQNIDEGSRATATHCINGHELNEENTYIRPDRLTRECKPCQRQRVREARNARRRRPAST